MCLLVSWLHCSEEARQTLFQTTNFSLWLQRLVRHKSVYIDHLKFENSKIPIEFGRIRLNKYIF